MTIAAYHDILARLREAFPSPTSNPKHDTDLVVSILRTLDQVDAMKLESATLGKRQQPDYEAARKTLVPTHISDVERVTQLLVDKLQGMPVWGHPHIQMNVDSPASIPAIIGWLLPTIYNPNLVSEDSSVEVGVAEVNVTAMACRLIGYDPEKATGVFTFGGTGTLLYGLKLGVEKAFPDAMTHGVGQNGVVLASTQSHSCRLHVAGWLGLGTKSAIEVPTDTHNQMQIDQLEVAARQAIENGNKIVAMIATMGTTDAFGIDDLESMTHLRNQLVDEYKLDYSPHIHADAVIGWAWSVFNDYDFEENELGFRQPTLRALATVHRRISKLHLADSVGIDFHKTGFTPYVSSLFLVRARQDMQPLLRERHETPYLFQTGQQHPGLYTLETSRSGCGVLAAYANLNLFGKTGMRALLGHLVEMAELLRQQLEQHLSITVLNRDSGGPVTLFRVYPDGVDTCTILERERSDPAARNELRRHNTYNRSIFQQLRTRAMRGQSVHLSMTNCYRDTNDGESIVSLKSYMLSPFVEAQHVELLVQNVLDAKKVVDNEKGEYTYPIS